MTIKVKNYNNETIKAGCVIENDKSEILLVSDKEGTIWTFPKGHVEEGETLEYSALREVKEETGYKVEVTYRLSDVTYTNEKNGELIRVAMFKAKPLEIGNNSERHIQSKWFTKDEAKKVIFHNLVFLLDEIEK